MELNNSYDKDLNKSTIYNSIYDFSLECINPSVVSVGKFTKGRLYKCCIVDENSINVTDDNGNEVLVPNMAGFCIKGTSGVKYRNGDDVITDITEGRISRLTDDAKREVIRRAVRDYYRHGALSRINFEALVVKLKEIYLSSTMSLNKLVRSFKGENFDCSKIDTLTYDDIPISHLGRFTSYKSSISLATKTIEDIRSLDFMLLCYDDYTNYGPTLRSYSVLPFIMRDIMLKDCVEDDYLITVSIDKINSCTNALRDTRLNHVLSDLVVEILNKCEYAYIYDYVDSGYFTLRLCKCFDVNEFMRIIGAAISECRLEKIYFKFSIGKSLVGNLNRIYESKLKAV